MKIMFNKENILNTILTTSIKTKTQPKTAFIIYLKVYRYSFKFVCHCQRETFCVCCLFPLTIKFAPLC